MSLVDDLWRSSILSSPVRYFIKTNTPSDVLKGGGSPQGERHYNWKTTKAADDM